ALRGHVRAARSAAAVANGTPGWPGKFDRRDDAVYPASGVWKSAAVGVTVLSILLSVLGSVAAAQTEMCAGAATCDVTAQSCLCGRDAETVALCPAAPDLINGRDACLASVSDTFNTCTNRCNPADSIQGRCAWIRNCLDKCRAAQTRQIGGCWTRYRNQLRSNGCPGSFVAGKKARRRCPRAKGKPCCWPGLPPTTPTTSRATTTARSA